MPLYSDAEAVGKTAAVQCGHCGSVEFDAERAEVVTGERPLRLSCVHCGEVAHDLPPDQFVTWPAPEDLHHAEQLPHRGCHWWLGLQRGHDGTWRPVALAQTLTALWDTLLSIWHRGAVVAIAQHGELPAGREGHVTGATAPLVEAGGGGLDEPEKPRAGFRLPVPCDVRPVQLSGTYGLQPGIRVRCSQCCHATESFGRGKGSVKRCLALMREECPRKERNFYTADGTD